MIRSLALCGLLLASSGLQAQDGARAPLEDDIARQQRVQMQAAQRYHARIASAIAATGRPRELAFAAHLRRMSTEALAALSPAVDAPSRPLPRDPEVDGWIGEAADRAGDDVLANQLVAAIAGDAAVRATALQRWQAADRGNLAPLLASDVPVGEMLVEARRMDRMASRMYDGVRWMMSVYLAHPPTPAERAALAGDDGGTPDEAAALAAMATWLALMTPAYPRLTEACRGGALRAGPARAADCRHVAGLLAAQGDSMMDRSIGWSLLRTLAADSSERGAIDASRRTMDWQLQQWGRIASGQPRAGAGEFVRLLRDEAIASEQQLMERVLQEAGVPLEPPAGWMPPRRN